jgi:hypothetical protein
MPRIAIASMFRNSSSYIDHYAGQIADLTGWLVGRGYDIHLIAAEGDSSDDTWEKLNARLAYVMGRITYIAKDSKLTIFKAEHGGPVFGSIENTQRWRNISFVCDKILEAVELEDTYLLYVESDLFWDADTMQYLLGHLDASSDIDAIAPLCIHQQTGQFYDTWGHRKDGQRFQGPRPYHPGVGLKLTEIDSAGSCIAMKGEVARNCRFNPADEGIVGFGRDIHAKGYKLWLDPQLQVFHP